MLSPNLLRKKKLNLHICCRISAKKLPQDVNPQGVFACNELDLEEVNVYGFDYDYTLADYKESLDYLLYNLGRDTLVQKYKVQMIKHSLLTIQFINN